MAACGVTSSTMAQSWLCGSPSACGRNWPRWRGLVGHGAYVLSGSLVAYKNLKYLHNPLFRCITLCYK